MPHIQELMAAGASWRLAKMLGQHRISTVRAAGASAADATELVTNFCLVATSGAGQGVALDYATDAAITAIYNSGPDLVLVYPAPGDNFNDLAADLPLEIAGGEALIAVPAAQSWIAAIGGGIAEAPADGTLYGRQSGAWVAVPPLPAPMTPPPSIWVSAGGALVIGAGIGRVYVTTTAAVTITLPPNDCMVLDRTGNRGNAIVVEPPGSATICGLAQYSLVNPWQAASFLFDGTNYAIG